MRGEDETEVKVWTDLSHLEIGLTYDTGSQREIT